MSDSVTSCTPLEIQFTNTSTFYSSVSWNFGTGQGISTLNNPIHFFSSPGIYPVKLIVTSPGGCLDSIIKTVRVFDTAGSRINYTPIGGCKPLSIAMSAITAGPMVSYFWDFGDGNTLTTTTPSANHIYTSFGSCVPRVILEDPSAAYSLGRTLLVSGYCQLSEWIPLSDYGTVNFIDSPRSMIRLSSIAGIWRWRTSNLQQPSHLYNTQGIYNVQLPQTQGG
jgi:PKD repeat protein